MGGETEAKFVIKTFVKLKSLVRVRRAFRLVYYPIYPLKMPKVLAFRRLVQRFEEENANDIDRVVTYFGDNPKVHLRQAVPDLNMSRGKIWNILRQKLKWKAYTPRKVQVLSMANKVSRLLIRTGFLSKSCGVMKSGSFFCRPLAKEMTGSGPQQTPRTLFSATKRVGRSAWIGWG